MNYICRGVIIAPYLMKKLLTFFILAFVAAVSSWATDYTGDMTIVVNGSDKSTSQKSVSLTDNGDGTYALSITSVVLHTSKNDFNLTLNGEKQSDGAVKLTGTNPVSVALIWPTTYSRTATVTGTLSPDSKDLSLYVDFGDKMGNLFTGGEKTYALKFSAVYTKDYSGSFVSNVAGSLSFATKTLHLERVDYATSTYSISLSGVSINGSSMDIDLNSVHAEAQADGSLVLSGYEEVTVPTAVASSGVANVRVSGSITSDSEGISVSLDFGEQEAGAISAKFSCGNYQKTYEGEMVIYLDGDSQEPTVNDVILTRIGDLTGVYNLAIKDFSFSDVNIGDITLSSVYGTEKEDGSVTLQADETIEIKYTLIGSLTTTYKVEIKLSGTISADQTEMTLVMDMGNVGFLWLKKSVNVTFQSPVPPHPYSLDMQYTGDQTVYMNSVVSDLTKFQGKNTVSVKCTDSSVSPYTYTVTIPNVTYGVLNVGTVELVNVKATVADDGYIELVDEGEEFNLGGVIGLTVKLTGLITPNCKDLDLDVDFGEVSEGLQMLLNFTTGAAGRVTIPDFEKNYEGDLTVYINGAAGDPTTNVVNVTLTDKATGTYSMSIKNFSYGSLNLGDIQLTKVKGETQDNGNIKLTASEAISISLSVIPVTVTVNLEGEISNDTKDIDLNLDMGKVAGQQIAATFSSHSADNPTLDELDQDYEGELTVIISGEAGDPTQNTVHVTLTDAATGTCTMSIKNFSYGSLNLGDIELTSVIAEVQHNGTVKLTAEEKISIKLGFVPFTVTVKLTGLMSADHNDMYLDLDMGEVAGQSIAAKFRTANAPSDDDNTTSDKHIVTDDDASFIYFNLGGQQIAAPTRGINIIVNTTTGEARKVIVK